MKHPYLYVALLLAMGLLVAACIPSVDGGQPTLRPSPTPDVWPTPPDAGAGPSSAGAPQGTAPTVTIAGVVQSFSPDTGVATLAELTEGMDQVAVTPRSEVVFADGTAAGWQDLRPGALIEASGPPGPTGAVLAERVTILSRADGR